MYRKEYYLVIKNEIMSFAATRTDLEMITLSEESQTEEDKCHDNSHMWNLKKMIQMDLLTNQKQTFRHRKQMHGYQRGRGGGGYIRGLGLTYTYHYREIISKDLQV